MKNQHSLDVLKNSHKGSFKNKEELLNYENCGCFLCLNIFKTKELIEWIEESDKKETAICPKCRVDSVLSEKYPISDKIFMEEMQNYWSE